MLRTNLATRPFYNRRAVRFAIGAALLLVAGLTIGNVVAYTILSQKEAVLGGDTVAAEARTRDLQRETRRLRQGLNREQLDAISAAARDANALIDRRVFSWTGLLAEFERTLPDDVRIGSIAPDTGEDGRLVIAVNAIARRAEDIERFLAALAGSGSFTDVVTLRERTNDEGLLEVSIQMRYTGPAAKPPVTPPQPAQ